MNFIKVILILTFCIYNVQSVANSSNYLTFTVGSQAEFNEAINTIKNYSNRQYIKSIFFNGFIDNNRDYSDISAVSIFEYLPFLAECVSLEQLRFKIGRSTKLPDSAFKQITDAFKNLEHVWKLEIYVHTNGFPDVSSINDIIVNYKKLTYFYFMVYNNGVSNICTPLRNLKVQTNLTYLYLHFAHNSISDLSCFDDMFLGMTELTELRLYFYENKVTNMNVFNNAFVNSTKIKTLYFSGFSNAITTFNMRESFLTLTKLSTLSYDMGPDDSDNITWSDFYIEHPTLTTIQYYARNFLQTSNQVFKKMPKLKRINLVFRTTYRHQILTHLLDQMDGLPDLYFLYFYIHYIPDSNSDYDFTKWTNIWGTVKDRITHIQLQQYWNPRKVYNNQLVNVFTDSVLPNLQYINFYNDRVHTSSILTVPAFNHTKVTQIYYRIRRTDVLRNQWGDHAHLFDNLPSLVYPQILLDYHRSLKNVGFAGYDEIFKSLQGKQLSNLYLYLYYNDFSNLDNLTNRFGALNVSGMFYFYLHKNQLTNLNGIKPVIESIVSPTNLKGIQFQVQDNKINDISGLSNAFSTYTGLTQLLLYLYQNDFDDLGQLQGLLENKDNLEYFRLYVRDNPIVDQTILNKVFMPLSYGKKSILKEIGLDYLNPNTGVTSYYKGLNSEGKYLNMMKFGYCFSTYAMAERFILGSNTCRECVNEFCYSCSKDNECNICRVSTPERILPLCLCPDGYYNGADHSCLQCASKCVTCNNGQNCLTCQNSTPKRIVPDCICPDGYYDDGVQNQCQTCYEGCKTCKDGISCNDCIEGYYQKGNQCYFCPLHFSKCYYDEEKDEILGLECFGSNRYYILPYCQCIEGYYPIQNFPDCLACNSRCTECTSSSECQACATKYYLNAEEQSCNRCNSLCQTCSNSDRCDTCHDRMLDPSTSCTLTYQQSAAMQQQNQTDEEEEEESQDTNTTTNNDQNQSQQDQQNTSSNDNTNNDNNNNSSTSDNQTNTGNTDNSTDNSSNANNTNASNNNDDLQDTTVASFSMFNPVTNQVEVVECDQVSCSTCQENICTQCNVGLNRLQNPPLCSCKQGYHSNLGQTIDCFACDSTCLSCQSREQCTQCRDSDNRQIDQNSLKCECKQGYKNVIGQTQCKSCFYFKDECLEICPQNTVQDQVNNICVEINYSLFEKSNMITYLMGGILLISLILLSRYILNMLTISKLNKSINKQENQFEMFKHQYRQKDQQEKKSDSI